MSEGLSLSDQTISILENFAGLNTSWWISPGSKVSVWQADQMAIGEATLKEVFPSEFAIYDSKLFLKTLRLFDNPQLHFSPKFVEIKDGNKSVRYLYADTSLDCIKTSRPPREPVLPEVAVDFVIPEDDFKQIVDCSSALGLPDLMVENDENGKIRVVLLNLDKAGDENISNRCTFVYTPDMAIGTFQLRTKMAFIKLLAGSYRVQVSKKASLWTNTDPNTTLRYWVCVDSSKSKWDK